MDQWKHLGTLDTQAVNFFRIAHYTIFSLEETSPLCMSKWGLIGLIAFIFYGITEDYYYPLTSTPSKSTKTDKWTQSYQLPFGLISISEHAALCTFAPCKGQGDVFEVWPVMLSAAFSLLSITNPPYCKAKTASQQVLTEAPAMCAI